ncbi:MAG: hypothetical protein AMK73_08175 [Planctomycetes bacterium SM23_32]|nr:MAG: hypothetical protein AMK73_08175 [Planctomycetes bacterium SM23_32]
MSDTVTCPNPKCRATISTKGKAVGDKVQCPKCGTETQVLATFGDEFNISSIEVPQEGGHILHPARQVCTACGAVLGVRDAVCPSCGGDVRTGRTQVRITREQKKRRGLLSRKPKPGPQVPQKAPVVRQRVVVSTGMSTGVKVLIGLGVLIAVVVIAVVALLMLT